METTIMGYILGLGFRGQSASLGLGRFEIENGVMTVPSGRP